jgi:hypothetical protein
MSLALHATRTCPRTGKVGYAHDDAVRVAKRAHRRKGHRMAVYRCTACRQFHVGHADVSKQRRRRAA